MPELIAVVSRLVISRVLLILHQRRRRSRLNLSRELIGGEEKRAKDECRLIEELSVPLREGFSLLNLIFDFRSTFHAERHLSKERG